MSALDSNIERMRQDVQLREKYLAEAREKLAALEAEREALAQAYPADMETVSPSPSGTVTLGVAMCSFPAHVTPADARRMAVWLAAFAEEHGA